MKKLVLDEGLFDDIIEPMIPETEATIEVIDTEKYSNETPNPGMDTGLSNLIIKAINGEWDTIAEYNELIANLGNNSDMISVIQDIVAEENTHIGQLQEILL